MGDFPYLDWLTKEYKKRAEESGHWTDYLKVIIVFALWSTYKP